MTSIARRLLMAELKAKRGKQKEISARVRAGQCIINGCGQKMKQRGLCMKHYNQFYQLLKSLPEDERIQKEQELIHEGLVLPVQEVRNLKEHPGNPFRQVAS